MKLLRSMTAADSDAAVALIALHDEDDAVEAQRFYSELNGCHGQFVLELHDEIIGVTGFEAPSGCEQCYWITWTYVHPRHLNRGHGRAMLMELIGHLRQLGARKLFVKVSDYVDDHGEALYAAALHLYESLGFAVEARHADFYDAGEAQIILGMRLLPPRRNGVVMQHPAIQFNEIFEIAETEGAWSFGWHERRGRGAAAAFSREEVQTGLDAVAREGARCVFLSFPSNYAGVREALADAGFDEAGMLEDYYEDGIDELHYAYFFQPRIDHQQHDEN
jgi:GNAT superfamily N-acetyltransferase